MTTLTKIKKLGKTLYPTGRAFKIPFGGVLDKLNSALSESEQRAFDDAVSILDSALPDNDNFTTGDATDWERRLGLITNPAVPLSDRKLAIIRKIRHPGNIPARQNFLYLQGQLQDAGFNVFVFENRFPTYADGIPWTARSAAEANSWIDVTFGNGLFVAISDNGGNQVMTSPNGITWTAQAAAEANTWRDVTFGNGLFVAVSSDGGNRVMTSPDGITWTARVAAEANIWLSVTFGNGLFVAVSQDGTFRVMTSPDGITWTARSAAEANIWLSVTFGNGLFVAVSFDGINQVMTSPDGITWTAQLAAEANIWRSITFGNGLFVAVSQDGTNRVMTSPDGIIWTARLAAEANSWIDVTFGNGLFVAISFDGTNRVMTSPDGITWTVESASEANQWLSVTFGNDLFVAVSQNGTNRVMTSPNVFKTKTAFDVASLAGTDVAVHGGIEHGEMEHMQIGEQGITLIANFIDEDKDIGFDTGATLRSTFFVGANPVGAFANVLKAREDEFRQLILKIKPVSSIGFLFINFN